MRVLLAAFAAALAWAATAAAQAPAGSATPEQIAAARKEGDELIYTARAQALFDNETGVNGSAIISLRHKASGFLCQFTPGQTVNNLIVYPNAHPGDDVGCNTMTPTGDRTTNFTRDDHTDEQVITGASVAIQGRFPGARPAPPLAQPTAYATRFPDVPTPKAARFTTAQSFEEDLVGHVDGWMVEDRFTAPLALAQSDALDAHWYQTVAEGLEHRKAPAKAADAPVQAPPQTFTPPATEAELIAASRKQGDRIMRMNGAQDLFENITDSKVIALRHKASGLVCKFDPDAASVSTIMVGPAPGATSRADAVSCLGGIAVFSYVSSVMPNRDHLTTAQALDAAVATAKSVFSNLYVYTGQTAAMKSDPGLPAHQATRMISPNGTELLYVYVGAAVVGDWIVTEQVTGPPTPPMLADMVGEMKIVSAIGDVAKGGHAEGKANR